MDPEFIGLELKTNLRSLFITEMLAFSQISKLELSDCHVMLFTALMPTLTGATLDLLTVRIMKHAGDFSKIIGGFTSCWSNLNNAT